MASRALRRPFALATLREVLAYLAVVVGGTVVASIVFLLGIVGMGLRPPTFLVWRTLALAGVLGYLLVTPTVVMLVRQAGVLRRVGARRRLEAALLALLLVSVWRVGFTGTATRSGSWAAFAVTLPPLLLWSAIRFHTLGACASLLLIAVFSTWSTNLGLGPPLGGRAARLGRG